VVPGEGFEPPTFGLQIKFRNNQYVTISINIERDNACKIWVYQGVFSEIWMAVLIRPNPEQSLSALL